MSAMSSSPGDWWSLLEPAPADVFYHRGDPEDPRLGEVVIRFAGSPMELRPGQPVLVGFPCDEGVRRNGGRVGAAQAPDAIRAMLYRATTWDRLEDVDVVALGLVDLGNVRADLPLEDAQERLGEVVAALLASPAVPIVLGGGHETAFGHYLGYVKAGLPCGIINIDAHLDVRPYPQGGHSGSPFRQAMEHPTHPLEHGRYVVIGAQRDRVARTHWEFVRQHGGKIHWYDQTTSAALDAVLFHKQLLYFVEEMSTKTVMLSIDADAFRQADVPGVSAPGPLGLEGAAWPEIARVAGGAPLVRSLELVEVNPLFDRDGQTARWAAAGLWHFLVGLAHRPS